MLSLGYPLTTENGALDYFCENAVQIEYKENKIRFIVVSEYPDIFCTLDGFDVFDIEATALFRYIAKNEKETPTKTPGETCFFPSQGFNLWEADKQYDSKGSYWRLIYAQVGIERPEGEVNA